MKIEINTPKISEDKTDSFFYDGEEIASIETEEKIYVLIAEGDIKITIVDKCEFCGRGEDETYRNSDIIDAILKYDLTDKKLREMEEKGKLIWENNNWFEVEILDKKTDMWECSIGDVAYDYDSGIELLKSIYEKKEKIRGK